ncbi:MAG: prepilin-type N-terminal cleavage/methylation domain-containing protein [Gemmatimonadetes bacterium]|nr:prepilin-type N-terminal cleavage/methylation domain-containing protein [Gemmatimonadota bacterium]
MSARRAPSAGFSLVEVMVAIVVLAIALLAMASATGFILTQVRSADLRTERSAVVRQVTEDLWSVHFDSVTTRAQSAALSVSGYTVWWDVTSVNIKLKRVNIYTQGLGFEPGQGLVNTVVDTVVIGVALR